MSRPLMSASDRVDVFRGLAHPVRRKILVELRAAESSVGELSEKLKVPMAALSQHLGVLRETGLASQRTSGHRRYYKLRAATLKRAEQWLKQFK